MGMQNYNVALITKLEKIMDSLMKDFTTQIVYYTIQPLKIKVTIKVYTFQDKSGDITCGMCKDGYRLTLKLKAHHYINLENIVDLAQLFCAQKVPIDLKKKL